MINSITSASKNKVTIKQAMETRNVRDRKHIREMKHKITEHFRENKARNVRSIISTETNRNL